MKIRSRFVGLICGLILVAAVPALAQEAGAQKAGKHVVTASGHQNRGGGEDTNIKSKAHENSKDNEKVPAPPTKSGKRGGCYVDVNNVSAYYIDIYAGGNYSGTVGPWGNYYVYPLGDSVTLYARADFTDNSFETWGPQQFSCSSGAENEWRLRP